MKKFRIIIKDNQLYLKELNPLGENPDSGHNARDREWEQFEKNNIPVLYLGNKELDEIINEVDVELKTQYNARNIWYDLPNNIPDEYKEYMVLQTVFVDKEPDNYWKKRCLAAEAHIQGIGSYEDWKRIKNNI